MKTTLFFLLLSTLIYADSTKVKSKEYLDDFLAIKKEYLKTDSLQIKRQGIMEYLTFKYNEAIKEEKKKEGSK